MYKHPGTGTVHQNQSRSALLEQPDVVPELNFLGDLLEVEMAR
ncbi:ATPase AAA [Natrialba chahannaoensis JCM 10990]|uniref:ATPase AAA n=1 Tax=Natrialba chahannaoensis JCM 10990 TaxID=1227492 RepID=M0AU39_9EURY|nr:hypothetical protein [Natrialba chahannaoensis]ELZ02050.1 ATPase AAA [Natrialba chahannaoensis JCM 10990]